ncbi:hypothetical protein HK105_201450 [Polyrhizophydium stewartii]|uniref:UspA domain-containing protein n=1 Tax=Polyrhizophydium stewartii TaxID=2732419 RepID=A0ABR4NI12_9FUNG
MPDSTRTILLATDMSLHSSVAIDWAVEHLIRDGDHLVLLHTVQETPLNVDPDFSDIGMSAVCADTEAMQEIIESARASLQATASDLRARLAKRSDIHVATEILCGAPGPSILAKVQEHSPAMVVVGTHGRTGLTSLLMGSVSSYVHEQCKSCPVILVRSQMMMDSR